MTDQELESLEKQLKYGAIATFEVPLGTVYTITAGQDMASTWSFLLEIRLKGTLTEIYERDITHDQDITHHSFYKSLAELSNLHPFDLSRFDVKH